MSIKAVNSRLGHLMANLIYPAFLGSALVWFFGKVSIQIFEHKIDAISVLKDCFALWLIVYFCITFLILTKYELKKKYDFCFFFLDVVDVLIIFVGFLSLGFVVNTVENFSFLYWSISAIPIVAVCSNGYSKGEIKIDLIVATTIFTVPMAIWGYPIYELNWIVFFVLSGLLIVYACRYHKGRTKII